MRSEQSPTTPFRGEKTLALCLGLFLFAAYLLVYRGGFHSVDEVSMFAVTESLVKFGQVNTDQIAWTQWTTTQREAQGFFGTGGHVYSKKGIGLSLAMVPLYWAGWVSPGLGMLQTSSLANPLVTATCAAFLFLLIRRLGYSRLTAGTVTLLFGLATIAAVYSKYLFSEPLAGLLLLGASYCLIAYRQQRRLWQVALAGLLTGLSVTTRANNLFLIPVSGGYLVAAVAWKVVSGAGAGEDIWAAWHARNRSVKRLCTELIPPSVAFLAGLTPPAAMLFGYNWMRSGNPAQTGYDLTIFSPAVLFGLYKLLFSPLRGLFVYSPLLLLAIVGFVWLWRRHRAETLLLAGQVVVTVLLFSAWTSGEGLSWGSRFLVPVVPLLCVGLAPVVERAAGSRPWLIGLSALTIASLAIQVSGVIINPWVFLAQIQTAFGGEFFLEKTAALADFGFAQPIGQIANWAVTNSDLAWWQPWGTDLASLLACVFLLVWAGVALWAHGRQWRPRRLLVAVAVVAAPVVCFFVLSRYYVNDFQFGPPDGGYTQALDVAAGQAGPVDRIVTVAPYHYHVAMNRFRARLPLIGFAQQDPPLPQTALPLLADTSRGNNVWLVTVGYPPAAVDNAAEAWLCANRFKATDDWFGDARLVRFGTAPAPAAMPIDMGFDRHVRLVSAASAPVARAGQVLPVDLVWQADASPTADWQVFLQVLSDSGKVVAQHDAPPVGGYSHSSSWVQGQQIHDKHGVALPADLMPGTYQVVAGLYQPADEKRLVADTGEDFVRLGAVAVQSP